MAGINLRIPFRQGWKLARRKLSASVRNIPQALLGERQRAASFCHVPRRGGSFESVSVRKGIPVARLTCLDKGLSTDKAELRICITAAASQWPSRRDSDKYAVALSRDGECFLNAFRQRRSRVAINHEAANNERSVSELRKKSGARRTSDVAELSQLIAQWWYQFDAVAYQFWRDYRVTRPIVQSTSRASRRQYHRCRSPIPLSYSALLFRRENGRSQALRHGSPRCVRRDDLADVDAVGTRRRVRKL